MLLPVTLDGAVVTEHIHCTIATGDGVADNPLHAPQAGGEAKNDCEVKQGLFQAQNRRKDVAIFTPTRV